MSRSLRLLIAKRSLLLVADLEQRDISVVLTTLSYHYHSTDCLNQQSQDEAERDLFAQKAKAQPLI